MRARYSADMTRAAECAASQLSKARQKTMTANGAEFTLTGLQGGTICA
jgi:hypothetical protein